MRRPYNIEALIEKGGQGKIKLLITALNTVSESNNLFQDGFMKIIFVIIILIKCSSPLWAQESLVGTYEICDPTISESIVMIAKGANGFIKGSSLSLRQDGSYEMTTCGSIIKGRWKVNNKQLILISQNSRMRSDSLHSLYGFETNRYKEVYNIAKDGKLWQINGKVKGEMYCTLFCKNNL